MKPGIDLRGNAYEPPFTVVIGYEDFASGIRALELYQRLLARWSGTMRCELTIWKFEPLGLPELSSKATEDALHADLILVSLSGDRPLPTEARDWIESWRGRILNQPAIALLLDGEHQTKDPAREIEGFFRTLAEDEGIAFFSSASGPTAFGTDLRERSTRPSARSVPEREPFLNHWGINE